MISACVPSRGPRPALGVAGGVQRRRRAPSTSHGLAVEQDERAVRELVERRLVVALPSRAGVDALGVELRVDRVGSDLAGMQLAPDRGEAVVVRAAAERARAVAGGEARSPRRGRRAP